jgi:hypothetical protein
MKKYLLLVFIITTKICVAQNVGIGTNTPDASSQLEISSTNKGVLIPRMNLVQRNAISNPAKGLLVFVIEDSSFHFNAGTATIANWQKVVTSNNAWGTSGNAGTNPATNFIGTTDDNDVVFKRNNINAGRIGTSNTRIGTNTLLSETGSNNTIVGSSAGNNLQSGIGNTAVGANALKINTTLGNTAIGADALSNTTTGTFNIGLGFNAQVPNPVGHNQLSISNAIYGTDISSASTAKIGIGTSTPTSKLNVDGQVTIDQKNFGGYGGLLLKGNVPGSNYPNIAFTVKNNAATPVDEVAAMIQGNLENNAVGAETIDLTFLNSSSGLGGLSEKMRIKANGNVGIGTTTPGFPLNFASEVGDKISLYGNSGNHYGFGIQGGLLQMHAGVAADNIAFGYGSSGSFTERGRIINTGENALDLNGRIILKPTAGSTAGTWLRKSNLVNDIGFIGALNDSIMGFYGTAGADWGLTMNNRIASVGIYNTNPRVPLSFADLVGDKISLFYNSPTQQYGMGISSNTMQLYAPSTGGNIAFGTGSSNNFTENVSIKSNGAIAVKGDMGLPEQFLKSQGPNTPPVWSYSTVGGSPGSPGQVLTSNGAGSTPTWQTNHRKSYYMPEVTYTILTNFNTPIPGAAFTVNNSVPGKVVIWLDTRTSLVCGDILLNACHFVWQLKTYKQGVEQRTAFIQASTLLTQPDYDHTIGPIVIDVLPGNHNFTFNEVLVSVVVLPTIRISAYAEFIPN